MLLAIFIEICDTLEYLLQPGTEPYIKIKAVAAGKWLQRLLFINPEETITAESDECYLLKGNIRKGCEATEFTDNVSLTEITETGFTYYSVYYITRVK